MGRTSTRIHHSPADKRRSNDSDTASPYDRAIRYRLKQRSRYATDNTVDTSCSVARRSLERKKIDPTFNIVVRARSYLGPRRSLYGVCVCVSVLEQSSDRESRGIAIGSQFHFMAGGGGTLVSFPALSQPAII